jgi:hypothetical protein
MVDERRKKRRHAARNSEFEPRIASSRPDSANRQLIITQEAGAPARVRIIGELTGNTVQLVLERVEMGVSVLDLDGIVHADDPAVHVLAGLQAARCALVACPRWLELWLARVRGKAAR